MTKIDRISDADLRLWATYIVTNKIPKDVTKDQMKRLAHRQVNLADVTSIASVVASKQLQTVSEQLEMVLTKVNLLEYVVTTKLGISNEEMVTFEAEYNAHMKQLFEDLLGEDVVAAPEA